MFGGKLTYDIGVYSPYGCRMSAICLVGNDIGVYSLYVCHMSAAVLYGCFSYVSQPFPVYSLYVCCVFAICPPYLISHFPKKFMLFNDELIMTHSAWHLCYTAEGHYLYEDLDSSCGCSTGTLQSVSESTFLYSLSI